jgi:hypothetical protein
MAKKKDPRSRSKRDVPALSVTVIEPAGGTTYFYANLVYLTWTLFDLKIRFGELTKIEPDGHHTITERAVATMAWPEAKILMKFLQDAVVNYEEVNGDIKIPPELRLPQSAISTRATGRANGDPPPAPDP